MRGPVWPVAAVAACAAAIGVIGADALWPVLLGGEIAHGRLPTSIPFATAPSAGWPNVPAGAELVLWGLYHLLGGDRGVVVGQAIAAAAGFAALAAGLRREASDRAVAVICLLVLAGSLPLVVVSNVSLFSLAALPLLLLLLEDEATAPTARIWWAVPLLAVWGNLHGAVLAGWALLACYLVFERSRHEPLRALGVLAAGTLALFVNAALWSTPSYYAGVFGSAPARRGEGLWSPPAPDLFGIALVVIVAGFALVVVRRGGRVRLWEGVALAGLAGATVLAARNGPWLLFLAAYPVARCFPPPGGVRAVRATLALPFALVALVLLVRGPADPASRPLARLAADSGRPVLAEAKAAQQVALAGGRVWMTNPVDAFRLRDQELWLDWLDGRPGGDAAVSHVRYVLVARDSPAGRRAGHDRRLALVRADADGALYRVRAPG
jgi:hypothetical protein